MLQAGLMKKKPASYETKTGTFSIEAETKCEF